MTNKCRGTFPQSWYKVVHHEVKMARCSDSSGVVQRLSPRVPRSVQHRLDLASPSPQPRCTLQPTPLKPWSLNPKPDTGDPDPDTGNFRPQHVRGCAGRPQAHRDPAGSLLICTRQQRNSGGLWYKSGDPQKAVCSPAEGVWYRDKVRVHLPRVVAAALCVAEAQLPITVPSEGADGPVLHEHDIVTRTPCDSLGLESRV